MGGGCDDIWIRQPYDGKDVSEGAIGIHVRVIVIEDGFVTIATALGARCRQKTGGQVEFQEWS
jgi:hypothetical protein